MKIWFLLVDIHFESLEIEGLQPHIQFLFSCKYLTAHTSPKYHFYKIFFVYYNKELDLDDQHKTKMIQ